MTARLTTDSDARKGVPMATGLLDYFPDALADVARLSQIGNDKHNPGQPMHWSRGKSDDHADCILRHMTDRGTLDTDGVLHDTKVAWRALAQLQLALEAARKPASEPIQPTPDPNRHVYETMMPGMDEYWNVFCTRVFHVWVLDGHPGATGGEPEWESVRRAAYNRWMKPRKGD